MERSSAERTAALADLLDHGPALEEPASVIDPDKSVALDKAASRGARNAAMGLASRLPDRAVEFSAGTVRVFDEHTDLRAGAVAVTVSGEQSGSPLNPQGTLRV